MEKKENELIGPTGSTGTGITGPSLYEWFDIPSDTGTIKEILLCEDDDRIDFLSDLLKKAREYRKKKYGSPEVNLKSKLKDNK